MVPAAVAVAGSVALSLLILHPPAPGLLLPGTPPTPVVDGPSSAVVLPAPPVARPHIDTRLEFPRPTQAAAAPTPTAPRRRVSPAPAGPVPAPPTPSPPPTATVPTPIPETPPVTTPTTPPPAAAPRMSHSNNGRWSSAKVMPWKGTAAKQSVREHKGKPPWAGQKGQQQTTATPPSGPAPTDRSKAPPGQSKTPPGQAETPPGQAVTPPAQDKVPPGQAKKGQSPPG